MDKIVTAPASKPMFYNPHDPANMDRLLDLNCEDQTGIDGRPSIEEIIQDES